jgi:hypothetical protein
MVRTYRPAIMLPNIGHYLCVEDYTPGKAEEESCMGCVGLTVGPG